MDHGTDTTGTTAAENGDSYPLKESAAFLNDRLGLYLSEEQKRGFAAGLLIGTALAGGVIAWSLAGALRGGRR